MEPDGFYLNGKRTKLIGLNRHQSYPYAGYAMGRRAQEKDACLLKDFMGLNMVRCSHYMQSRYFLDKCDELGLMAVSYTHLDVYKRQLIKTCWAMSFRGRGPEIFWLI